MINAVFNVDLESFKATFFDRMSAVDRAIKRNSEILAGQIRTTAQRSIKDVGKLSKKKKKELYTRKYGYVSKPGDPPLSHTGLLKDFIFYGWDSDSNAAIAGPAKIRYPGCVPRSLEMGQPSIITIPAKGGFRKSIQVPIKKRPYMAPAGAKILTPKNIAKVYAKSIKARKGF